MAVMIARTGGAASMGMAASFILLFFLLIISSHGAEQQQQQQSIPLSLGSQQLPSFTIIPIPHNDHQGRRSCSYTVKIKTSCSSIRYTHDAISLAFGDAYRNEVYAARLDEPRSRTFERCSTDTFEIKGACGYGVCYLYLRRIGRDGWTPEWVKVYEPNVGRRTTYYYGTPLPNAVWFGFNNCPRPTTIHHAPLSVSSSSTI